jgi:hypothetical protein
MDISDTTWRYRLEFNQDSARRPVLRREEVWRESQKLLTRPNDQDRDDPQRLTQTHLEQVNANKDSRVVAESLAQVRYLHLVPKLVRDRERYVGHTSEAFHIFAGFTSIGGPTRDGRTRISSQTARFV